jgi:hypothetical protein
LNADIIQNSLANFEKSFVETYKMDRASASLNYLAIGIGFVLGLHISRYAIDGVSPRFSDRPVCSPRDSLC